MRILYGTGNPAKLEAMKRRLESLEFNIEVIGLRDIACDIPEVIEDGNTPLENARKKAASYYNAFHIPVFSCDSGLYFDDVADEDQPGVHVRTVKGRYLTDSEMIEHYSKLARRYGDITARYKNAISFVIDAEHIYEAMEPTMESEPFILTSRQHKIIKEGFPLDSLSIDMKSGRYFYDMEEGELDQIAVEDGFIDFFEEHLKNMNSNKNLR